MRIKFLGTILALTGTLIAASPVSAFSATGPHFTDPIQGGYTVVEGNAVPFDFLVEDYPVFPLQSATDPSPDQPSAWLDVTVDYGDGSPVFTESYPAVDTAQREFHIKDRTWNLPAHPAFDDTVGFIFNEFPYYRQYPQGHLYTSAGSYSLYIRADLRSEVPGLDVSAYEPLKIEVPVQVITATEAPELSIERTEYDSTSDELSIEMRYQGPQSLQFSMNNVTDALREELENSLRLEVARMGSPFSLFTSNFTEWQVLQLAQNQYKVTIQNASTTLGLDPAVDTFWVKLMFGQDGMSGLLGANFILDGNLQNNYQEFPNGAPLKMTLDLGANTTIRLGRALRQNGVLNNINSASTSIAYTTNWGDGSVDSQGSSATTGPTKTFTLNHTYQKRGIYTISTCANDGFREVCDQVSVRVN